MDFDELYLQELGRLRTLGQEFAQEQPMVASYLAGESGDPDVERLMQGFAFLTAMVRRKLDDEIPEFIGDVTSLVGTDISGPLPAVTVLKLDAVGKIPNGMEIKAGSEFASQPVGGTSCIFSTAWPITVQPVVLNSCSIEASGATGRVTLNLELQNLLLAQWTGDKLSLFFSGPYPEAANMAYTVLNKLRKVSVRYKGANDSSYPLTVSFPGLDPTQSLFPVKAMVAKHLRWARQSLAFPERGFFIELSGFNSTPKPPGATEFSIDFDFLYQSQHLHKINNSHFTLNAVPASNIFDSTAIPIQRTGLQENYLIAPMGFDGDKVEVFDVLKVTGREQGNSTEHEYYPTSSVFLGETGRSYQVVAEAGVRSGWVNHYLRLPFNDFNEGSNYQNGTHKIETLSLDIRCTNRVLAENVRLGEINLRTPKSPEKIVVTNVTVPIGGSEPAIGNDAMWKVAAHARLNLGAAADTKTIKELLTLYVPEGGEDVGRTVGARRRVEGIEEVSIVGDTRLEGGNLYRGSIVTIQLNRNFYACTGDLYLFANLIAYVFAGFVELNTYVTVRVRDVVNGELYEWPYLLSLKQTI